MGRTPKIAKLVVWRSREPAARRHPAPDARRPTPGAPRPERPRSLAAKLAFCNLERYQLKRSKSEFECSPLQIVKYNTIDNN